MYSAACNFVLIVDEVEVKCLMDLTKADILKFYSVSEDGLVI